MSSVEDLAFGSHSRSGAPALVDVVHTQVRKAYAQYRKTIDADIGNESHPADCCIYGCATLTFLIALLVNILFAAFVGASLKREAAGWCVFATGLATCATLALWVYTSLRDGAVLRHLVTYNVSLCNLKTLLARRERVCRALERPVHAALLDYTATYLVTGQATSILREPLWLWSVAPTVRVVEAVHATLVAAGPAFAALTPEEQQRAVALAVVDVCMFGEPKK